MDYCFCAEIYVPKFLLNSAIIFIFLDAALFVLLNEKIGLSYFCIVIFSISLGFFTNHDVFVFCCILSLPFRMFSEYIPFSSY